MTTATLLSFPQHFYLITFQYLKEVTPVIVGTVEFIVNTLPRIQYWISAGYIVLGLLALTIGYFRLRNSEASEAKESVKN
jgi:hypothetical protein